MTETLVNVDSMMWLYLQSLQITNKYWTKIIVYAARIVWIAAHASEWLFMSAGLTSNEICPRDFPA